MLQPMVFATYNIKKFAEFCVLLIVAYRHAVCLVQLLGLQANDGHLDLIHFSFHDWLFNIQGC